MKINTDNKPVPVKEKFIDARGLKIYMLFLGGIIGTYLYMQFNGISLFKDSNTEHEGNQHIYGGGHHK